MSPGSRFFYEIIAQGCSYAGNQFHFRPSTRQPLNWPERSLIAWKIVNNCVAFIPLDGRAIATCNFLFNFICWHHFSQRNDIAETA
jgi:hypothetical protein